MGLIQSVCAALVVSSSISARGDDLRLSDDQPLRLPPVGAHQLRLLTPDLLELTLVTTKKPDPAHVEQWDFISDHGQCRLPGTEEFTVSAGDNTIPVRAVGFKRRVLYAPLKARDLRIGNYLYLQLAVPVTENESVEVKNPNHDRWGDGYNLSQEFVILNQARGLAYLAWLMAQTPLKAQPWKPVAAQITGLPAKPSTGTKITSGLSVAALDLTSARIVWEADGQELSSGSTFTFTPAKAGPHWLEAEAQLPDGRRVFGVADFHVSR